MINRIISLVMIAILMVNGIVEIKQPVVADTIELTDHLSSARRGMAILGLSDSPVYTIPLAEGDENSVFGEVPFSESQQMEVTITEDTYILVDATMEGVVNSENGAAIHVTGGKLTILGQSVLNCDIYLENNAILEISGRINGTLTVNTTRSADTRRDWDGSLIRPNNLQVNSGAYVREIVFNGTGGFGGVDGDVDKITYTANCSSEMSTWANAYVKEIIYNANTNNWFGGHIETLYQTSGGVGNNSAHIDKVYLSEQAEFWIDPGAYVGILYSKSDGWIGVNGYNAVTGLTAKTGTIIMNSEHGGIDNRGIIKNLIVYRGSVNNRAYIENVYLDGCDWFSSQEEVSAEIHNTSPYMVKNLYSRGSTQLHLEGLTDSDISSNKKYGIIDVMGGNCIIRNTIVDQGFATGEMEFLEFENSLLADGYFDAYHVADKSFLSLPDPKSVTVLNARVSERFFAKNYDFISDLIGLPPKDDEKYQTMLDLYLEVGDLMSGQDMSSAPVKYSGNMLSDASEQVGAVSLSDGDFINVESPEDIWFAIPLTAGDMLGLKLHNYYTLGVAQVIAPDGMPVFVVSSCNTTENGSFLAEESGNYLIKLSGARFSADITAFKISTINIQLNTYISNSVSKYEEVELRSEGIGNFTFSVYDETLDKAVTEYSIKNGKLYLMPDTEGHRIRLDVVHSSINWGNYWGYAPALVNFTAGESNSLDVICRAYGFYDGWSEDFTDARGYVYNADGNLVQQLNCDGSGFWSNPMPDGEYAVVFIRDPASNYGFLNIGDFTRYRFKQNEDYVLDTFTNNSGVITRYENLKVPPAPVLDYPYLNKDTTGYFSPAAVGAANAMYDFTLLYDFAEEYRDKISNITLELQFSEDCLLMEDSGLRLNGKKLTADVKDSTVTAALPLNGSSASFTVTSSKTGVRLASTAVLKFDYDGKEQSVFIGAASVEVVDISINGPSATSKDSVSLYGYATPNSEVTIFDGTVEVARIMSKDNGFWSTEAPLSASYDYLHKLRAALYAGMPYEATTETIVVQYSPVTPEIEHFVFSYYVHGHADRIEIAGEDWGKQKFHYDYWPGSIFTFEVELSNSEYIDRMWMVSTNDNTHSAIEGFYEEGSGTWIVSGHFTDDESYVPGDFKVEYTLARQDINDILTEIESIEIPEITAEDIHAVSNEMSVLTESDSDLENMTWTGVIDVFGDEDTIVNAAASRQALEAPFSADDLLKDGYQLYEDEHNQVYYKLIPTQKQGMRLSVIYSEDGKLQTKLAAKESGFRLLSSKSGKVSNKVSTEAVNELTIDITTTVLTEFLEHGAGNPGWVKNFGYIANQATGKLKNVYDFTKAIEEVDKKIEVEISQIRKYISDIEGMKANMTSLECMNKANAIISQLERAISQYEAAFNTAYFNGYLKLTLGIGLVYALGLAAPVLGITTFGIGTVLLAVGGMAVGGLMNHLVDYFVDANKDFQKADETVKQAFGKIPELNDCRPTPTPGPTSPPSAPPTGAPPEDPPEGPPGSTPTNPTDVGLDPSGYVFEAVESNRLSGVTAKVYYQSEAGDAVLWDAGGFQQINPLKTDAEGRYQWFVPKGLWKVTYELDGYESAESEWMPVPPPRVDVNQALTSYRSAKVVYANVYTEYAEIMFDKYLDTSTVWELIRVTGQGSAELPVSIEAVNPEQSGLGDGRTFASVFRTVFIHEKAMYGQTYTLIVGDSAQCYAGVSNTKYSASYTCDAIPRSLSAEVPTYLESGEEVAIPIHLDMDEGFDDMRLVCVSGRDDLAEVSNVSVFNTKGVAYITLKTAKAGATSLHLSLEGTALEVDVPLVVARDSDLNLIQYVTKEKTAKHRYIFVLATGAGLFLMLIGAVGVLVVLKKRRRTKMG